MFFLLALLTPHWKTIVRGIFLILLLDFPRTKYKTILWRQMLWGTEKGHASGAEYGSYVFDQSASEQQEVPSHLLDPGNAPAAFTGHRDSSNLLWHKNMPCHWHSIRVNIPLYSYAVMSLCSHFLTKCKPWSLGPKLSSTSLSSQTSVCRK